MGRKDAHDTPGGGKRESIGFLDTLSEIHQLSVAEKNSSLTKGIIDPKKLLLYFTSSVRMSVISVIVTSLLSPFMFAVHDGMVPVFGSYEPTTFDRVFVALLTTSFPLGVSLLVLILLVDFCFKNNAKKAVLSLVKGLTTGTFFMSFVVVVVSHILYYRYLTPEGLVSFIGMLPEFLRPGYPFVYWTLRFIDQLIPAAYFQAAVNLASLFVIYLAMVVAWLKTMRLESRKEVWQ